MIKRRKHHGITLVEVLAGLAIIGTVLVSIIMAKSRLMNQWARNTQRLEAVQAADKLLAGWWQNIDDFPRNQAGTVTNNQKLRWNTQTVISPEAEKINCEIVRLELFGADANNVAITKPLVSIDIALPVEKEDIEGDEL